MWRKSATGTIWMIYSSNNSVDFLAYAKSTPDKINKNANTVVLNIKLIMPKRLIFRMYEEISHGIG